jgi:hypothetical protein
VELLRFVDDLRERLLMAAEAGGDDARLLAERLLGPLDSSVRLVLLEALSAAADEITSELAPGSVDVRLRGLDPEFVVTSPPTDRPGDPPAEAALPAGPGGAAAEGALARITLRIPEPLKARVEGTAGQAGVSVNSWLVTAVERALGPADADRRPAASTPTGGQRITGWAR